MIVSLEYSEFPRVDINGFLNAGVYCSHYQASCFLTFFSAEIANENYILLQKQVKVNYYLLPTVVIIFYVWTFHIRVHVYEAFNL